MQNFITFYPNFTEVANQDWQAELPKKIQQAEEILNKITDKNFITEYSLKNFKFFLEQLNIINYHLNYFGVVAHLNSVINDTSKRENFQNCSQMISEFNSKFGQNEKLYHQFKKFESHSENFSTVEKKIIQDFLIDFEKSGVSLEEEKKKKLLNYNQNLAKNSSDFFNHVLDDTNEFVLFVEDEKILEKMPSQDLERAKKLAIEKKLIQENENGFAFSLQGIDYLNVMQYCSDSNKRKEMYTAYTTRATKGERDNSSIILDTLKKRGERAKLLNYQNHIEYTLVDRMADSKQEILDFSNSVLEKSFSFANKEIQELKNFAKQNGHNGDFCRWDTAYWSEILKKEKYNYNTNELRNYFPYQKVFNGLFQLIEKLFGYQLRKKEEVDVWHPEVECYEIYNQQNQLHGILYIDLFTREKKGQGAWVNSYVSRHVYKSGEVQLPVGYLICNFSPKDANGHSYLFHNDVVTLFHEMGHALHVCLTNVQYSQVSGTAVPWDGVELPSQFFENFAWNYEILSQMTQHKETKEVLPMDLYEKLIASKNFHTGMHYTRQIEFGLIDLELHDLALEELQQNENVEKKIAQVKQKTSYLADAGFEKFQNAFNHVFSGGYSAGYYSYLWALVYACDAFDAFLEEDNTINYSMGKKFLDALLSQGGSDDFKKLYFNFRGQQPKVDALLKHNGLI